MLSLTVLVLGCYALVTLGWAAVTSFFVGSRPAGTFILLPPLAFVLISLFVGGIDAIAGIVLLPVRLAGLMFGGML